MEVTYQNNVDLSAYLRGTITIRHDGGTFILGDEDAVFIDKSEFKTIAYSTTTEDFPIPSLQGNATAEVFVIFGESANSLEYTLRETLRIETVSILDESQIEFGKILFDKRSGKFLVEIRNTGDVDVFVNVEMIDLIINDELVTLGADDIIFIEAGDAKFAEITTEMTEDDLADNPRVTVRAYYGERERSLIYVIEGEFGYGYTGLGYITGQVLKDIGQHVVLYLPLIIIIILLLLILGMKKKCPHCAEINNLRAKKCKKCGNAI